MHLLSTILSTFPKKPLKFSFIFSVNPRRQHPRAVRRLLQGRGRRRVQRVQV